MEVKTILVADDAPNIRKVVKLGFEALGYRVLTAANGREALELIRKESPDLAILDVMMPEMSGYDLCALIKRDPELWGMAVVMLTAKNLEEDKYWGRELGADAYITKPYDPEELEQVVERIFLGRALGESFHPLTNLPNWAAVEHEIARRRAGRQPFVVLACRLAAEAAEIYRMKYGNIKMDAILGELAGLLNEEVKATGEHAFVGHAGDNVFYLLLAPEVEAEVREKIEKKFRQAVPHYYSEEDAARGLVAHSGAVMAEGSPLMSLVWHEEDRFTEH